MTSKIDLWQGDCLELMKRIPDGSIDLVLTDPPYQLTACKWDKLIPFEPMWNELKRIIKPNGAICLFGSEPFSSHLRLSNLKWFKYDWIWHKSKPSGMATAKYMPMKNHEIISIFCKNKTAYHPIKESRTGESLNRYKYSLKTNNTGGKVGIPKKSQKKEYGKNMLRNPTSVKFFKSLPNNKNHYHPTQKPVALLEYLIKTYTLEGETVLDFTAGSFSTGVAAVNLNRSFIGIELDKDYFEIGKKRVEAAEAIKNA